uniref:Uncharacterized protein n=1 Tax=Hemiselmis tepida TaxID=464990 RepID=A0A7S0YQ26_9CRYP|mmetsp:Transcript_20038/g.50700  ORF Transcript_20038/g.50700 Transcript_20038/m.50700 type:complete len:499 (+) Transcript_20038:122-1618(+)
MAHPLFSQSFGGQTATWAMEKSANLKKLFFGKTLSSMSSLPGNGPEKDGWRRNLWRDSDVFATIPDFEADVVRQACEALSGEVEAGLNIGVKGWEVEELMRQLPHVVRCLMRIDDAKMRMHIERRMMPRAAVERFDTLLLRLKRSEGEARTDCEECAAVRNGKKEAGPNLNQASRLFDKPQRLAVPDPPPPAKKQEKQGGGKTKSAKGKAKLLPSPSRLPSTTSLKMPRKEQASPQGAGLGSNFASLPLPARPSAMLDLSPPTVGATVGSLLRIASDKLSLSDASGECSLDNSSHGQHSPSNRPRLSSQADGNSPSNRSRLNSQFDDAPGSLSRQASTSLSVHMSTSSLADIESPTRRDPLANFDAAWLKPPKPLPKCQKCRERGRAQKAMLDLVKGGQEGKVGGFVATCFCCVSEFSRLALARKNMEKAKCRFCNGKLVKGKDEQAVPEPLRQPPAEALPMGLSERARARVLPSVPQLSLPPVGRVGLHQSGAVTVR